jgi:ABC-type multidrug transport system fused ATPase/permease subunit
LNNLFTKVLNLLESKDYIQIFIIFSLTLISAVLELLGIGLIIPILKIFVGTDFENYTKHFFFLTEKPKEEILVIILFLLGSIYLIKFFLLRFLFKKQFNFSHKLYARMAKKFFEYYLFKNYLFHIQNNSSKLIRNIITEGNLFSFSVVMPLLRLASELIVFFSICILLIIYETQASILTISFFSLIGYVILLRTNNKLKFWGEKRQYHSGEVFKQLQQGFMSIREVIINSMEKIFLNKFHEHNLKNAHVGINKDTITQMPRLILELIGMFTFLTLVMFLLNSGKNINEIFVIIGVFFYAAIRLLPAVSKIVQSIQSIQYNRAVINVVYKELSNLENKKNTASENRVQNNDVKKNIEFKNINFDNVNFQYPNSYEKNLKNINIEICDGDKVGIIGQTGSGKSTFVNLLCGLLHPNSGIIKINKEDLIKNEKAWQNEIGYVPQNVSIIDESILFNIVLEDNPDKIDLNRVNELLKQVNLFEHVYNLPKKLYELAGENGVKLSGGQKQRIGIIRALYKNPSILIMDEATSSLDEKTEDSIIKNLFNNNYQRTIISISHRPNSLKYCNRILEVRNKTINEKIN